MRLEIERGDLFEGAEPRHERRGAAHDHPHSVQRHAQGLRVDVDVQGDRLEREVSESVDATVSQPGTLTVPAHMLHESCASCLKARRSN